MKYVKVLDDIKLVDLNDNEVAPEGKQLEISFKDFVLGRLSDPKFAKSMDMVFSALQIKQSLKDLEGDVLVLDTSDWQNLLEVVKEPSPQATYHPLYAFNLVPFMKAIVEATDNKPEPNDA